MIMKNKKNIPMRKITKQQVQELQQLGKTSEQIAEYLGCSVEFLESHGIIQEDSIKQNYQIDKTDRNQNGIPDEIEI